MRNTHNDEISRNLEVIITGERTKHRGKIAKVTWINGYEKTVDLRVQGESRLVTLSINSVRPNNKNNKISANQNLYLVYCKTTDNLVSDKVDKETADEIANDLLNSGKSLDIIVYRAIQRKVKKVVSEKI